ncbi:MAG: cytochrome c [Pseudomonadota bacterium]
MSMKYLIGAAIAAAVSISVSAPSFADPIDDVIEARRGYYKLVGLNFGQVVAMAKGEADYDAEAAKNAATNLQALSKLHLLPLFPPGSDNEVKKGKTRSLAKIWSDFPGVVEKVQAWQGAVDNLVTVSADGRGALGPAVGEVGKTCGACHDAYRAKNF